MATLPHVEANLILNWIRWGLQLRNDRELSEALGVKPPVISKLRRKKIPMGPSLWVRIMDLTDTRLRDIPSLAQHFSDCSTRPAKKRSQKRRSNRKPREPHA